MISPTYIFISGFARSGKDLCAKQFEKAVINHFPNKKVEILSLAAPLRSELFQSVLDSFGINIYDMSDKEKEVVRPLMVAYGDIKRWKTKGRYFIDLLDEQVKRKELDVVIIPDLRYKEYDFDELDWAQSKNGFIVHMRRFSIENGKKKFLSPPNDKEKRNDPKIKKVSDFRIANESFEDVSKVEKQLLDKANEIVLEKYSLFV